MLNKKFLMFLMILGTGLISENNNLVAKDAELKQCEQRLEEANRMLEDANNNVEVASRAAAEYKKLLDEKDKGLTKKRSSSVENKEPDSMEQIMEAPSDIVEDKEGNIYILLDNENKQSNWNCFDVSVHLEKILKIPEAKLSSLNKKARARYIREEMVETVLRKGSQDTVQGSKIRELLAREIVDIHFNHTFVENPPVDEIFSTPRQTMELIINLFEKKIGPDFRNFVGEKFNGKLTYEQYEMFQVPIFQLASRKEVFKSYMENYYKKNNFAIAPSGEMTSIINVLAEIYPQYQFVIFAPVTKLKSPESKTRVIVPGKIVHSKTVNPSGKKVRYIWFDADGKHFKELRILKDQNQIQRSVSQVQNQRSENQSQIQKSKSQSQIQRSASNQNVEKKVTKPVGKKVIRPDWKI